jgi:hypothetical protein
LALDVGGGKLANTMEVVVVGITGGGVNVGVSVGVRDGDDEVVGRLDVEFVLKEIKGQHSRNIIISTNHIRW